MGEERLAFILAPYMKHRGVSFGMKGSSMSIHDAFGLVRITSRINLCDKALHMETSSPTSDVNVVERTIVDCAFKEAPVAVCQQFEAFCNGICEAIDPSYEFAYDRMMTKGDKTCHWTIKKKGEVKEKEKGEVAADDPARILAIRYAKGEIAKEELQERMNNLKELGLVR